MPDLTNEFYLTAEEIASLIIEEGIGPDDSEILELEAQLDDLSAELGVCDLDPVADHLLDMVEDELANLGILGRTAKSKRRKDPRRRYKGVCIRPDKRLAIYLRDKFCCVYCEADLHGAQPFNVTLEHLKPRGTGGGQAPENLITACRSCNCTRQDAPLRDFATPEARQRIRRNIRRSFTKYRVLAKALLAGEVGLQARAAEFITVGEYIYRRVPQWGSCCR